MHYVEAPTIPDWGNVDELKSLFLAGSITGCPDWQKDAADLLQGTDLVVYNPRRENFPIHDPSAAQQQIEWEHNMLREADAVSFWFSKDSLGPIVLYELGAWSMTDKPVFVGVEPGYKREQDVRIQTSLVRPEVEVFDSLEALMARVIIWSMINE
jgi:hypothetical protein